MKVKKILVYLWRSNSERTLIGCLERLGFTVFTFQRPINNYHADAEFALEMIRELHGKKPDAVFSYDYFPLIASVCCTNQLPYLSWIYDWPLYTLWSPTIRYETNYLFCFDRMGTDELIARGAVHACHLPLAVDIWDRERWFLDHSVADAALKKFRSEIAFVGSFYNEKKNRLRSAKLTEYTRGYLEGVICAQLPIYGCNLLNEGVLNAQVVQELIAACELKLGKEFETDTVQLAADCVSMEVTARERESLILQLGQAYEVSVYTASEPDERFADCKGIHFRGTVDDEKELPFVYRAGRINLNMTSRTITSGIPLRVLDVLACGGFLITNYQPEIAELFKDGQELVIYTDVHDCIDKVSYYLKNDAAREKIARRGHDAVKERFRLDAAVKTMLDHL